MCLEYEISTSICHFQFSYDLSGSCLTKVHFVTLDSSNENNTKKIKSDNKYKTHNSKIKVFYRGI